MPHSVSDASEPFSLPELVQDVLQKFRLSAREKGIALRFVYAKNLPLATGDIALLDPNVSYVVRADESPSTQEYTPFEGHELDGKVTDVWVRGTRVLDGGSVVGSPTGEYQFRPTG